ncbi:MAG: hypothetical protein P8Q96_04535 [Candidatus Thalassarchaeaceae archaeon]|jgi:hypothetical protein|nr:hypothetical protein [Euryarchaeota archaeon]MDG1554152.1 hypothetical protein [Candidatus Thalassarchaeaceae archaeon]DAC61199.1 MAG TPA: hypothetical protein D7I02_05900 [Candidatus Poseidoniales archaeon]MBT3847244.1 hypothetical protein [Euryarchaeota archaeon]MBT4156127.1 hypothetical protein [Euryarchaeota archaeon]
MRLLVDEIQFSVVSDVLVTASSEINRLKDPVLLLCEPTILGSLSISVIESSLIDNGISYRRKFNTKEPKNGPWIKIIDDDSSKTEILTNPLRLTISSLVVEGLTGHKGDSRKGPLTSVAQCHALAQIISPHGPRTRKLRPWLISGNWINSALDHTYDPLYSAFRDLLSDEGSIRVVPLPEVPEPDVSDYEWIDIDALNAISSRWVTLDMEGRARALSHLIRSSLIRSSPSTSRLEEIVWHCVMGNGWSTDLASQISSAKKFWEDENPSIASSKFVDKLIRDGQI